MTQEEFIQKTMIALMGNPEVTNADNFDDFSHHTEIHKAALYLSNTTDEKNESVMYFDDVNSTESDNFPENVSERECLAVIAVALQAIANNKTIKDQQEANDGNFEYSDVVWP